MTMREPEAVCVNLDEGFVVTDDNEVLPITNMFDEFGDDCNADEAVAIVAGRDGYGWLSIDVQGRSPIH